MDTILQEALIICHEFKFRSNSEIMNVSLQISRDFDRNSVVDAVITTFQKITKANIYLTVTSGTDSSQKLKTVFDLAKVFDGIYGNVVLRSVMENFAKSADFELKFPFEPVRYFSTFFLQHNTFSIERVHHQELIAFRSVFTMGFQCQRNSGHSFCGKSCRKKLDFFYGQHIRKGRAETFMRTSRVGPNCSQNNTESIFSVLLFLRNLFFHIDHMRL